MKTRFVVCGLAVLGTTATVLHSQPSSRATIKQNQTVRPRIQPGWSPKRQQQLSRSQLLQKRSPNDLMFRDRDRATFQFWRPFLLDEGKPIEIRLRSRRGL